MTPKKYLAENPKCDVIHSTSDGNLFYAKSDATNHAKSLEDKTVTTTRQTNDAEGGSSEGSAEKVAPVIPYAKRTNDWLKEALSEQGIAFDDAGKKADFIALLEEADKAAAEKEKKDEPAA